MWPPSKSRLELGSRPKLMFSLSRRPDASRVMLLQLSRNTMPEIARSKLRCGLRAIWKGCLPKGRRQEKHSLLDLGSVRRKSTAFCLAARGIKNFPFFLVGVFSTRGREICTKDGRRGQFDPCFRVGAELLILETKTTATRMGLTPQEARRNTWQQRFRMC